MRKSKGKRKRTISLIKPKKSRLTIEEYLDRSIRRVEDSLIPRIENLKDEHTFVRQELIKLDERQERIFEDFIPSVNAGIQSIHDAFDKHTMDESRALSEIRSDLSKAATHVEVIQNTLDNVSANGNKGLSASFTDVYNKIKDLEKLTEGARTRKKFRILLNKMIESTPLLRPLKKMWGIITYAIIAIVIINVILYSFGVRIDIVNIIEWLITAGREGK